VFLARSSCFSTNLMVFQPVNGYLQSVCVNKNLFVARII